MIMKPHHRRLTLIAALLLVCGVAAWFCWSQRATETAGDKSASSTVSDTDGKTKPSGKDWNGRQNPNFPVNDNTELPFLGKIRCHTRQENVKFAANGKQLEWPFKIYYLPNGMFVRAEYVKPGAKIAEFEPKELEVMYRSWAESLVGFPDKTAPASLAKVLENLYTGEAFDRATKINITWVLREGSNHKIESCFIANVWGVSPGLMSGRVPENDEGFLKYRILLTPEGEAIFSDNLL